MFKCSGCGLCCQHIDKAVDVIKDIPEFDFPYSWDATGRCEKLDDNNHCTVYETRPLMCNVDKVAEYFDLDKEQFYNLNTKSCNDLMDEHGVELQYRI